jgi:hypothetical protein
LFGLGYAEYTSIAHSTWRSALKERQSNERTNLLPSKDSPHAVYFIRAEIIEPAGLAQSRKRENQIRLERLELVEMPPCSALRSPLAGSILLGIVALKELRSANLKLDLALPKFSDSRGVVSFLQ